MGFKTFIWEPNAMPGLANRLLARFVDEAFVVFDEAKKFLSSKNITRSGMPVRKSIEQLFVQNSQPVAPPPAAPPPAATSPKFRVFAFGGSQGARGINENLSQTLIASPDLLKEIEVIHQTGKADYEKIRSRYHEKGLGEANPVKVLEYVNDMEEKYKWADLIICRSGTGTLSELSAVGKPSLLIPFPFAADNHQQKNAEVLVNAGAAEMLLQKDLTPQTLRSKIEDLKANRQKRESMTEKVKLFHQPQAAENLAQMLLEKSK